jgi:membrane protein DedA with SNARE-associated domain
LGSVRRASPTIPRNRYLALLALVVLVISAVELAAGLGLPLAGSVLGTSASSYFSSSRVISLMTSLGYASLFALMTLESASLPIPSEVVLPFAGYLAFLGVMNLWVALAVSTVAALTGAMVDYILALKLGNAFVESFIRRFGLGRGSLETAEDWFRKRGAWTVFGARFVPVVRSVISLPAGLFKMPVPSFLLFTATGCVVWNAVLIYAGFAAGALWQSVVGNSFSLFVNFVLAAFALVAVTYLVYYALGRRAWGN